MVHKDSQGFEDIDEFWADDDDDFDPEDDDEDSASLALSLCALDQVFHPKCQPD